MTGASRSGRQGGHTFVVPAYGCSPHLAACLESLRSQSFDSEVLVSTSTPSPALEHTAARFGCELFVHRPSRGIGRDWNAAVACSRTDWTTIAHQDDVYDREYAGRVVAHGARFDTALIVFTDYAEMRDDGSTAGVPLLSIKRVLLEAGFLGRDAIARPGAKRRVLRFGSPIPCPAVTYHRRALDAFRFREDLRVCLDWAAWLELASRPGAFVWLRETLVRHRIHGASETSAGVSDGTRAREDLDILETLWPRPIARAIAASYAAVYPSRR